MKEKNNEATTVASPRVGEEKAKPKIKVGEAHQQEFINFLTKALGDIKDVSISIDGGKRIPVKDLKKKIN
jgi:hypothetical protein|tara:strand:- start:1450 stop:1659 length:210 start_codon:yes stop_codon:yes gene_type:complete